MNKKNKYIVILLFIQFLFISSFLFSTPLDAPYEDKSEFDEELDDFLDFINYIKTAGFQYSGLSITQDNNLVDGMPYVFSGSFWNDIDFTEAFTEGYLETKLIGDDVVYNDTISVPSNYKIGHGDTDNIAYLNGSLHQDGDLQAQDGDYAVFNSSEGYHYPGTYSFYGEAGKTGTDINFADICSTSSNTIVVDYIDKHRDVLKQTNIGGSDNHIHIFPDGLEDNGVREFWIRLTAVDKVMVLVFYEGSSARLRIKFDSDGDFKYEDSIGFNVIQAYAANKWYHIRINWDSDDTFDLYLDGSKAVNNGDFFDEMTTGIDRVLIVSLDTTCYLDAFGSDKDSNYILGANYYWQYYLGSETFEEFNQSINKNYFGIYDFEDYSLYDEAGNYTAEHGFDYTTEQGWYFGSPDNFNDEDIDTSGTNIAFIDYSYGYGSIKINAEKGGHKNVLALTHDGGANDPVVDHHFPNGNEISGIREFWIATSDITKYQHFSLNFDGIAKITISIWASKIQHYPNNVLTDTGVVPVDYTFNHIKITFDCSAGVNGEYQLYVDGIQIGGDHEMRTSTTYVNKFRWICVTNLVFSSYLDAWGDPADANYNDGDNKNPYNIQEFKDAGYILQCAIDSHIRVNSNVDGHEDVLEFYDNNSGDYVSNQIQFTEQIDGTIEFWYRTTSTTQVAIIRIFDGGTECITFPLSNTGTDYYYDGTYQSIQSSVADIWQHFRIEFDCTVDTFDLYINGSLKVDDGDFRNGGIAIDKFLFSSYSASNNYYIYIDALDFSWSSGYVDYRNSNPYGQLDELEGDGWDIYYSPYTSISIIYENNFHNKILNITDDSTDGIIVEKNVFSSQVSGTIEYWLRITDATLETQIAVQGGSAFYLRIQDDKFGYYDGAWKDVGLGASDDTWYHIRIDFECGAGGYGGLAADTWKMFINGTEYGDYAFFNVIDSVNYILFYTDSGHSGYSYFIDAFSYSWDPSYEIGWNTNPYIEDLIATDFNGTWTQGDEPFSYVYIDGEYNKYRNKLTLVDNSTETHAEAKYEFTAQTDGIVEFWLYTPPDGKNCTIQIGSGTSQYQVYLKFDYDGWIKNYLGTWNDICTYNHEEWTHIRIDFDCGNDDYDLYVNRVLEQSGMGFIIIKTTLSYFAIKTIDESGFYNVSLDSLSFNWLDPLYNSLNVSVDLILDFNMTIPFDPFDEDTLQYAISRYQKISTETFITLYIFNFTSGLWVNITAENNVDWASLSDDISSSISDYMNGTYHVIIRFYAKNSTDEFKFYLDLCRIKLYHVSLFSIIKTLYIRGAWKYRFHLVMSSLGDVYTDWILFDVVEMDPNVVLNSESIYTTRWDFHYSDISEITLFEESFDDTTNYWDLYDVPNQEMSIKYYTDEDTFTSSGFPTIKYHGTTFVAVGTSGSLEGFIGFRYDYLVDNYTQNSVFYFWVDFSGFNSIDYNFYRCEEFLEEEVDGNNEPTEYEFITTKSIPSSNHWYSVTLEEPSIRFYKVKEGTEKGYARFYSRNRIGIDKDPYMMLYLSKHYQGSGYVYMQTDETETLTIRSPNTPLNLQSGDQIEIWFQTSTSNKLEFNLLSGGSSVAEYELSEQGNSNYALRKVQFSVDSDISINQMEITGVLNDQEYAKLMNVKIFRYNSSSESITHYVNPGGTRDIFLPYPNDFIINVYERNRLRINYTITTSSIVQYLNFQRIAHESICITYYDANGDYLNFFEFRTYVNYTYDEISFINIRMSDNILYVDEDSMILFLIYDSFDYLVKTYQSYEEDFIDITLDVYSLKIKNEYVDPVEYSIKNIYTAITKYGSSFSGEIVEFIIHSGTYHFNYTKDEVDYGIVVDFQNNMLIVVNSSKICFLSYANQKGEYLSFNNYKTYIDGSIRYFNTFYGDIGDIVDIEIKDRYGISIKNDTYTVQSDENYIFITLTEYSLKVYNQQPYFNHINITRDPNYYESDAYWSEWLAPGEIIKFNLFSGYYKINFTRAETADSYCYAYTLNGDDVLLISSSNTIYNVLQNIENVNTTIGNQITNVWIDITNQNSNINNSIINIDINLSNLNSTLGNMLLYQNISLTNIQNNISALYIFTENNFVNLGNNINVSFINIENNIISINESISLLILNMENNLSLINGTITTMISSIGQNILLMETNIQTSLFYMNTTLNIIGNNITDAKLAIINDILIMNNTIMTGINQIYSSIYLVNNSIYNVVAEVGSSLSIINNTISGNISLVLQQNEFLTELYRKTLYSELLNWTDVGYNTSFIENQIVVRRFVNDYKDTALEIQLKYQNIIETLRITAQSFKEQYLPKDNVTFRVYSIRDETYLTEWTPLEDEIISFGFYEEISVPKEAEVIDSRLPDLILAFILLGLIIASLGIVISIFYKKSVKNRKRTELILNGSDQLKSNLNKKRKFKF